MSISHAVEISRTGLVLNVALVGIPRVSREFGPLFRPLVDRCSRPRQLALQFPEIYYG